MSEALQIHEMWQNFGMVAYYSEMFANMFAASVSRKNKKSYTVVDVGFNTGQFTRLARLCFDKMQAEGKVPQDASLRIIGFEPNVFLVNVAPIIQGLELFTLALSDEEGTQTLYVPIFRTEPANLEQGAKSHRNEYGGVYGISTLGVDRQQQLMVEIPDLRWSNLVVQTTTLDTFCQQHNIDEIDWLKIDVEFFERKVLMGAKNLLAKNAIRCGQFEGNIDPNVETLLDAFGNNARTQLFLDESRLRIIDPNYNIVQLPTTNRLIEGEFFFIGSNF